MARILLVEDNEMNRDMLERRLKRRGYEILIAVDGAESVEMTRAESPDLILMDMSLPVMDGYQATRILKENPATAGIPILGLSAHAMSGDADKAMAAGCDDYDTKPVEIKRLLGKIELLLEGASAEAPPAAEGPAAATPEPSAVDSDLEPTPPAGPSAPDEGADRPDEGEPRSTIPLPQFDRETGVVPTVPPAPEEDSSGPETGRRDRPRWDDDAREDSAKGGPDRRPDD